MKTRARKIVTTHSRRTKDTKPLIAAESANKRVYPAKAAKPHNSKPETKPTKAIRVYIDESAEPINAITIKNAPKLNELIINGRKNYRLTQSELAHRTRLNNAEISRLEKQNILRPSKNILKALSPYTGKSYSELLHYAGYSTEINELEYYDFEGKLIPCRDILRNIYSADVELLTLMKDIDVYTTYEDRELLKLTLRLMKKFEPSEDNERFSNIKTIFDATKQFVNIQLSNLFNMMYCPSDAQDYVPK